MVDLIDKIDKGYTKDQIRRVKELIKVLYIESRYYVNGRWLAKTTFGLKSEVGLLNTILSIMFGEGG